MRGTRVSSLSPSTHVERAATASVMGATVPEASRTWTVTVWAPDPGLRIDRTVSPPGGSNERGTYQRSVGAGTPDESDAPCTPELVASCSSDATRRPERVVTTVDTDDWSWT